MDKKIKKKFLIEKTPPHIVLGVDNVHIFQDFKTELVALL